MDQATMLFTALLSWRSFILSHVARYKRRAHRQHTPTTTTAQKTDKNKNNDNHNCWNPMAILKRFQAELEESAASAGWLTSQFHLGLHTGSAVNTPARRASIPHAKTHAARSASARSASPAAWRANNHYCATSTGPMRVHRGAPRLVQT